MTINLKRAIGYALLVYITSSIVFALAATLLGASLEAPSLGAYVIYWLGTIVLMLLFAKWYFKVVEPTTKSGLYLGLATIAVSICIDLLSIAGAIATDNSIEMFASLYGSWQFYTTIIIVLLTTTYAGFEFDSTYTASSMTETDMSDT